MHYQLQKKKCMFRRYNQMIEQNRIAYENSANFLPNWKTINKNELVNKYDEVKDGTIVVHRNNEDTVLTLITCKKNEEKQTVFINRLIEKENY